MGLVKPERSDVFELTEQDFVEQAVLRYGGRYELLSLVGAGAYGSVYRARDTELEEIVAVKVLRSQHIVQPDALERFRREVRLARRVAHPNVARTYDIGSHEGERFLTMEYIDGHPLTRLSPINAALIDLLPLRLVIEVAVQLCAGLGALHAAGIIHRDMKTDKVLSPSPWFALFRTEPALRRSNPGPKRGTGVPVSHPTATGRVAGGLGGERRAWYSCRHASQLVPAAVDGGCERGGSRCGSIRRWT